MGGASVEEMTKSLSYWIKERNTPQGHYYVACGQLTRADAKKKEDTLYGSNVMHQFDSKLSYDARLAELRARGERVQT